jgi:hypothetical protein
MPWDFAWDECTANFESGTWLPQVRYVGEDDEEDAHYLPPTLYCGDDLTSEGW